jgi:ABC-type multidrug transport system ATPase subunit
VRRGERLVIHGRNGAGKSTLLQVLAGVLSPDRGVLLLDGNPLHGRRREGQKQVGYVPEAADPPGHLSVGELLHFVAAVKGCDPPSAESLAPLALEELMGERISELSLGQRRRACLAAALTGQPSILLLDEPTNGLDLQASQALAAMLAIANPERILICATHDLDFASAVETRRVEMSAGAIVE